ncbi:Cyn operon transcriptional activator [Dermatophilus congolensis]|uniref:Cyn operon transcriptional activator n=1 Tax=Dermatophilus congolensis TaxID=1863 RepID=A0AA46BM82_9MICO|nr:LysR family transcriptional regulator [Dermatophilus congolensis]STD06492.1 Cyn operon transcriptional activator [Dermatophilus congolensis]
MDIRQLRYFLAVSERKSLSSAARNLYVTQPTLTVAMKKLETDVRARLFVRTPGSGYELTEAGRRLYEEGSEIVRRVDAVVDEIRAMGQQSRPQLRVGLTVLFAVQHMPAISAFIAGHTDVEVTLVQSGSMQLQKALVADEIDVAIVSHPIVEPEITVLSLPEGAGSYRVSAVMRSDNPLAGRESVTFAQLRSERFCALSERFVLGRVLRSRAAEVGFTPAVVLQDDSWEVLLNAVRSLNAVALLPSEVEKMSVVEGLSWVPLDDKANRFPIGIATHGAAQRNGVVDEFVTMIRQCGRSAVLRSGVGDEVTG